MLNSLKPSPFSFLLFFKLFEKGTIFFEGIGLDSILSALHLNFIFVFLSKFPQIETEINVK